MTGTPLHIHATCRTIGRNSTRIHGRPSLSRDFGFLQLSLSSFMIGLVQSKEWRGFVRDWPD
jgi:hypothetical protein